MRPCVLLREDLLVFKYFYKNVMDRPTDGWMDEQTDGWTEGWMDGQMDAPSYRDARTHLKIMCLYLTHTNTYACGVGTFSAKIGLEGIC